MNNQINNNLNINKFPKISKNSENSKNLKNLENSKCFQDDFRKFFGLSSSELILVSGPCSVENFEMLEKTAAFLSRNDVKFLRVGLYKPRTSPYDFQGLKSAGLEQSKYIAKKYSLISVAEITNIKELEIMDKYIDVFQIGSRNMQNFELLKEIGKTKKPVLLKRNMGATLDEFLFAAEYIAVEGNTNILLCERGIRTFENNVRNMLDIASIALIKKYISLPIIADISHSLGRTDIAVPVAKAVLTTGADGLMIEVHPKPQCALSDKFQQLDFAQAQELFNYIN